MSARDVVEMLGGEQTLRRKVGNPMAMVAAVREGLPYRSLEAVMQTLGLSRQEVSEVLSLPPRTLARRKQQRRLQAGESDRLYRLARVGARAVDVLGSAQDAVVWLRQTNRALGGAAPLELLETDAGVEQVDEILGRIEYGMFS